ncbi:hypothetical protein TRICI_006719 [Trichomonascus ciferrii]|uniref:Thioredoxin domain-containing protein n=1 Tax=Trichomonascus ciferrii TaxID=44093 RepID=A0A642UED9_9ASCO|nr:hypothetical protein TRICI_006719 [Trichomonascus ciferrii]
MLLSHAIKRGSPICGILSSVRGFKTTLPRFINNGEPIPPVDLQEGIPSVVVNLAKETAQGRYVLVGVPGAFSPACTGDHVPGYITAVSDFKKKGIDGIFIVSVNDAFVSGAWAQGLGASDKVRILADSRGNFTERLGLSFDASDSFGNDRSKRYAMIIKDGKVVEQFVEPDALTVNVSKAQNVLDNLK